MIFCEPLCNSHQECPDVCEKDIHELTDVTLWSKWHDKRQAMQQEDCAEHNSLGKTKQKFTEPMISHNDHKEVAARMKQADG